ncbi:MAG: hypothetical protein PHO01_00620 [Desulfotomaculaceae bacterium]|nr:hypothetical protein [Desulfotomaculaceae bacterium]
MSEWLVVLVITRNGQRIAISTEPDGPVLGEATTQEEALKFANDISVMTGIPLFSQEYD